MRYDAIGMMTYGVSLRALAALALLAGCTHEQNSMCPADGGPAPADGGGLDAGSVDAGDASPYEVVTECGTASIGGSPECRGPITWVCPEGPESAAPILMFRNRTGSCADGNGYCRPRSTHGFTILGVVPVGLEAVADAFEPYSCFITDQRSCVNTNPMFSLRTCGITHLDGATFDIGSAVALNASPMREMVKIGEFEIDQHEVAVGRFRTFWESEDRAMPASVRYPDGTELVPPPSVDVRVPPSRDEVHDTDTWSFQPPIGNGYEHRPITGVDFWTALAFCAWEGGRLPTGAEWEYAARYREGRELASGEAFSGDDPPRTDESCGDIVWGRCDPLGRDPIRGVTTREGDLDRLSGNVAEWTADSFRPYSDPSCWPEGPLENPLCNVNDGADGLRTIRGGSYRSTDIDELRTASRIGVPANTQRDDIGFRCVRDVTR